MGPRLIGFLTFLFVGMTTFNRILEGSLITASDVAIINKLTITHDVKIGWLNVPALNIDFFRVGLVRLVKWDYSFFGGNAAIFQYFLYSLTFALAFMLFLAIVGMVSQFFGRS